MTGQTPYPLGENQTMANGTSANGKSLIKSSALSKLKSLPFTPSIPDNPVRRKGRSVLPF